MGVEKYEVSADKLDWHCDPAQFAFNCTKDLAPLREFVGQKKLKDVAAKLRQFAVPPAEEKKSGGS